MEELETESVRPPPSAKTFVSVAIVTPEVNQENPDTDALKRLFNIALETRNFEISQLVQRNNFFMIFQGVLLAGVVQSSHAIPVVSFLVCLAGFAVSLFQVQMAAGAKFWQEYWEAALQKMEEQLISHLTSQCDGRRHIVQLFHEDSHIYEQMVRDRLMSKKFGFTESLVMRRFSVSRVPISVAITLTVVWFFLVLCTLRGYPPLAVPSFIVGFKS